MIIARPSIDETTPLHDMFEQVGLFLLLAGIFGRLWSVLYIGGRKNRELVTTGPYSITRNPLYMSSLLAVAGVSTMFGSVVIAVSYTLIVLCVFLYTANREADYLRHTFGVEYDSYAAQTPLLWPKPSLFRVTNVNTFSTYVLFATFKDALFFISLIPLMKLLEHLHVNGILETHFIVP